MAAHTYQIAIKDQGIWFREYVCAEDRVGAINQLLEEYPLITVEGLVRADIVEVERCA